MNSKVLLVSDHPQIGAIVSTDSAMVAFDKQNGRIDLSSGHTIEKMPKKGLFRNVNNETIREAGEAIIENRPARWTLPIIHS